MHAKSISRRTFVKSLACASVLGALDGRTAMAQTQYKRRLNWETFRTLPQLAWFISAIAAMRANPNENDPHSMKYWSKVHQDSCKHGVPYFLSWHRGCLFYFERQLQEISGHPELMMPYWDYYKNPTIPYEFTNPAAGNPLYETRLNTNVRDAITLAPFSHVLTNFETGTQDSFERALESRPHDPIHDIIGSVMATMASPRDPIFWLHHTNIDRLWTAWVAAGGGRRMPPPSSPYWSLNFSFGPAFSMNNAYTLDPRILSYYYDDATLPQTIVAQAAPTHMTTFSISKHPRFRYLRVVDATPRTFATRLQALKEQIRTLPNRPPVTRLIESARREIDARRIALASVRDVLLDHTSQSARVKLTNDARQAVSRVAAKLRSSPFGVQESDSTMIGDDGFADVQIVLDKISMTALGEGGGYFYKVFLNLAENPDSEAPEQRHLVGTFGAFKIAGVRNHARMAGLDPDKANIRIAFSAARLLANFPEADLADLVISFVRISGENTPVGNVVRIGEARIDVTKDSAS